MIAFARTLTRIVRVNPGHWYLVTSPLTYTERILEDGSGPTYHELAVLFVRTTSKRKAKYLAVLAWRRSKAAGRPIGGGIPDAIADNENPFRGMRVEIVDLVPEPVEAFA